MKNKVLLATRNQGKIAEMKGLLPGDFEIFGLEAFPDLAEVEETGATFAENALLKAGYAARHSGLTALADDSGLEVEALEGAPGVRSARFYLEAPAGWLTGLNFVANREGAVSPASFCGGVPDKDALNIAWLLERMKNIPAGRRQARFCSVIAAVRPNGEHITAAGFWHGQVLFAPRGSNGFGYDPVFFDPELELTAAQMDLNLKNSRSHRAKALRELAALWPDFWARKGG